jgi:uncharacterized protein YjbJ (UPF0337 family)
MDKNIENNPMNHNSFAGQWKQMRGTLKSWWGKLSNDPSTVGVRDMKAKVHELGETAASKARVAVTALGDEFATAGSSMQENKLATMATDLRSFVRKYPFALLLVGIGLGCLLFRNRND